MAEPEKAIPDYFYINRHLRTEEDFRQLRLNRESLLKRVSFSKIKSYLKLFGDKTLEERITALMEFIKNA
jgi:hypothetical protein